MRPSTDGILFAAGLTADRVQELLPGLIGRSLRVRIAPKWLRAFWPRWVAAMAYPWGVYVRPNVLGKPTEELGPFLVHELAHLEQWARYGVFGFLIRYTASYLSGRFRGLSHRKAYQQVSLEQEAEAAADRFRSSPQRPT